MRILKGFIVVIMGWLHLPLFAQTEAILTKEEAIRITLQENLGIQMVNNNIAVAQNNKSVLNNRFIPTVTINAGRSLDIQNQEATFQDGSVRAIDGAETNRTNASLNLGFILFDGLGRYYDLKRFAQEHQLSALQAREVMENTLLQLMTVYYEVARLRENVTIFEQTYQNSQQRYTRTSYSYQYGQTTKLEVLNAQVDLVNDSINLINQRQQLENTIRDLGVILNQSLSSSLQVEGNGETSNSNIGQNWNTMALANNVRILQAQTNLEVSKILVRSNKAVYLPTIGLTGSYGWNEGIFPATNFLASNTSNGISAGVNVTWNLFDGGLAATRIKNAKIGVQNQELIKKQIENEVIRDVQNAREIYINRLAILELQEKQIQTAEDNYNRSSERYKLGAIPSVELRQAQINLLNAQTGKNAAYYSAKLAELELYRVSGVLLDNIM